jgi:hypothetical protein
MKLTDFDTIEWNAGFCAFCSDTPNNVGNNLCDSHTDIYRKLKRDHELQVYFDTLHKLGLDLSQIENVEVEGIDFNDAHDFVDAFIASADQQGKPLTDDQLDFINESCRDFVYEQVMKKIY